MTTPSVAQALLWKEARERALVLAITLLLPLVAAFCAVPFCSPYVALGAAMATALLCALLIGATLTPDEDAAGGLAFERNLPVSALTVWLGRYLGGAVASACIVIPVVAVVHRFGAQRWAQASPGEYAAATWLLYATGAYFSCAVRTNVAAVLLGVLSLHVFWAVAFWWNANPWSWTTWGIAVPQFAFAAGFLLVANAGVFIARVRNPNLGRWSRTAFVAAGLTLTCLGASAKGLLLLMDWRFLDLSDVKRSDLMASPKTNRVLVSFSGTHKYDRCSPLARSRANLIYDAETDTLTRVTSKVRPCSRPWSPGGRRVLMQNADRRFSYVHYVYDVGASGLQSRRRIPHWSHALGWLTDRELVFWTWSGNSAGRHKCGAVDVVTGAERTIGRVRYPHRFLGTQGDTKLVLCFFSWDTQARRRDATVRVLRMGKGLGEDIALPLGAEPHQLSTDGRYLLLSTALPKSCIVHLSLYDLEARRAQPLQSAAEDGARTVNRSGSDDWALSPDGRRLAVRWSAVRDTRLTASVEVLDLASGNGRVLCEQSAYGSVTFCPNSRRLAAWDGEGQMIEVFSVLPGDDAERWVVPLSVPDHWLKLAWAGSDRLLLALPVRRSPWHARLILRSFRRLVRCSSDTLWIVDLKTKQVRMIWPQKWVHPTWRVLTHEEWKEKRG